MKNSTISHAVAAYNELRKEGYGRDTWMAFKDARTIVRAHFGHNKLSLIEQVIAIENVSKSGHCKKITGNRITSVKGGETRKSSSKKPERPAKLFAVVKDHIPLEPSKRVPFLRSEAFDKLCLRLPEFEKGEIIYAVISVCKQWRKKNPGVYFSRDPVYRPNIYNIGRTDRSFEERMKDAGGKGRYWELVIFLPRAEEREIHKLLRPWRDYSGRGSEIFKLDEKAQKLIYDHYKTWLPIT